MISNDIYELLTVVLASIGGTAIVVGGLAGWIGKVWLNRIHEADKARFSKELETLKSGLTLALEKQKLSLDVIRTQSQKFSSTQFDLYADLWTKLQDLKSIADDLWEKATRDRLFQFVGCLVATRQAVEKAGLFLEPQHYKELKDILEVFGEFEMGKRRLIEIRSNQDFDAAFETERQNSPDDSELRIQEHILANHIYKQTYAHLLERLRDSLREQITGYHPTNTSTGQ